MVFGHDRKLDVIDGENFVDRTARPKSAYVLIRNADDANGAETAPYFVDSVPFRMSRLVEISL
jgi:hypothetical protein